MSLLLVIGQSPLNAAVRSPGPVGWLVLTRRGVREVRPLATRKELAR